MISDQLESAIRRLVAQCTSGGSVWAELKTVPSSLRSKVVRVPLDPPWRGRDSLIAKQSVGDGATERFNRELAALRLLRELELDSPVAPILLGWDPSSNLFLLEDLGEQSLASLLLGRDCAAAHAGLLDYSRALGRLHATTIGRGASFIGSDCGGNPTGNNHGASLEREAVSFQMFCGAVGVALGSTFSEEVRAIVALLSRPGPFHALTHGDPCPGNERRSARGTAFLDFETSSFDHALVDAAYLCMGFPTCWCAAKAPDEILAQALLVYRQALSESVPEAGDDATFARHLQYASARWLLDSGTLVPRVQRGSSNHFMAVLSRDWTWGCSTARQRVLHRLQQFVSLARNLDHLPSLTDAATRLHHVLASRWGGYEYLIPSYPAFCSDSTDLSR